MASLSLIPSNKKRFPSWIDSGSLSPSPLNFNSNHEKSQQRKTETFILVLFNTKRENVISIVCLNQPSWRIFNKRFAILPRIVGDVGQSEQPPQSCCLSPASVVVESVVLRRKQLCKKEEKDLILFSYFFFLALLCLVLGCCCCCTRSVEQRVTSLWRHLEMRSRWWREKKKTFTYRQKEPPGYTLCILPLSFSLCVLCLVVALFGCSCCCWVAEDLFVFFFFFIRLVAHTHTPTHSHPEEKEHTHQSAMGSVKGRRFDRVWMRVWKISSFWSSEKWNGEKEKLKWKIFLFF